MSAARPEGSRADGALLGPRGPMMKRRRRRGPRAPRRRGPPGHEALTCPHQQGEKPSLPLHPLPSVPSLALPGPRSLRGMPTLSSSGAPIRPSALCSADWEATPWVAEPRRRLYSRPCPLATSARLSRAGIAPLYPWQRPRSRCGGRRPRRRESWHGHSFRGRAFYLFGV